MRIWNPVTGALIATYGQQSAVSVNSIAMLPDQTVVTGRTNGLIRMFDSRDGEEFPSLGFSENRLSSFIGTESRKVTALVRGGRGGGARG